MLYNFRVKILIVFWLFLAYYIHVLVGYLVFCLTIHNSYECSCSGQHPVTLYLVSVSERAHNTLKCTNMRARPSTHHLHASKEQIIHPRSLSLILLHNQVIIGLKTLRQMLLGGKLVIFFLHSFFYCFIYVKEL